MTSMPLDQMLSTIGRPEVFSASRISAYDACAFCREVLRIGDDVAVLVARNLPAVVDDYVLIAESFMPDLTIPCAI
jgi:hypothetical protein